MPDRMPDRMPENMSDRMPEDLPVTKCINVMVGITRSKVIFKTYHYGEISPLSLLELELHPPVWGGTRTATSRSSEQWLGTFGDVSG